jgi:hypothetical protein
MKLAEFFMMSAFIALIFSIVIIIDSSTPFGFGLGIFLFVYFLAVVLTKGMWKNAVKVDNYLSGNKEDD